jgi:hypothetical protein
MPASSVFAQEPEFEWAKKMGGGGLLTDITFYGVCNDTIGNVYSTGEFTGAADFDPGPGSAILYANFLDVYITKSDSSGNLIWARNISESSYTTIHSSAITVDNAGNVYITGYFGAVADFDPGPGIFNVSSVGACNIYVLKLDPSGNFLWVKTIENPTTPSSPSSVSTSITTDAANNVIVTGGFRDTPDFDPGPGTTSIAASNSDIFILKLDPSGNFIWVRTFGGAGGDSGQGVRSDTAGNIYASGSFSGTVDFDPGAPVFSLPGAGLSDIFILKLDASGNFVWAKSIGGTGYDVPSAMELDASGNVYTAGTFYNTCDFDPGAGTMNLSSAGVSDIFISKLDASGNFIFGKRIGSTGGEGLSSLSLDGSNNVYITGNFNGSVDFDPNAGTFTLSSTGGNKYISRLDSAGNFIYAEKMTFAGKVASIGSGSCYFLGSFFGTVDFDPGTGTHNLTALNTDIFNLKLSALGNFIYVTTVGSASSTNKGNGITTDSGGNVYTTGFFGPQSADLDPGAGILLFPCSGLTDVFITKMNGAGDLIWSKKVGGTLNDAGNAIAVDAAGFVYVTGTFMGTVDFDPGAGTSNMTAAGANDIFILKLDVAGNFIWAKRMGGTLDDIPTSIKVDASGNVYSAGGFKGSSDFDPGTGTLSLSSAGSTDIFISKLDSGGNFVWAKRIGGSSDDFAYGLALDASTNVFTTGTFVGSGIDFDPNAGVATLSSPFTSAFISKLDAAGNYIGAVAPANGWGMGLTTDSSGNVYVVVSTYSSSSMFKMDPSLTTVWSKLISNGSYQLAGRSIAIDPLGYVYTTGDFEGLVDFDPGAGTFNLNYTGDSSAVFILKLDNSGNFNWAGFVDGTHTSCGKAITITEGGTIYTAGWYNHIVDFDPGTGIATDTATGRYDIFIHKLAQSPVWPGDANHDSIVNNLDLLPIGLFYAQIGPPRATISNAWQEYIATNWGMLEPGGADIKHADCNGDGVINNSDTLAINLNFSLSHAFSSESAEIRATDPDLYFVTASSTYNSADWVDAEIWAGTSSVSVSNLYGIAFNLNYEASLVQPGTESLSYPPSWIGTPGTNVITIAKIDALTNIAYPGITRIDHLNGNGFGKIANFRFQVKTSISSPAVLHFSVSNCIAHDSAAFPILFNMTADSILINPATTAISNLGVNPCLSIYPNPFSEETTLEFTEEQKDCSARILDIAGRELRKVNFSGKKLIIEKNDLPAGVYFVNIVSENKMVINKKITVVD